MMDMKRYPPDWKAISHRIRFERAGGKCEQCGAAHGHIIWRYISDPSKYLALADPDFEEKLYHDAEDVGDKPVKVILTVHHIGVDKPDGTPGDMHDKMDCRDENLIALCQRCHLLADLPEHIASAKVTRLKNKHTTIQSMGQKPLWSE